ncbi:MAG: type II toxin-antitoxin system HicB family antitoxin [Planctomycetota bacterium]
MKAKAKKRTPRRAEHWYTVIFEPDKPGYNAFCPALPGCHSCGDTIEEAMKNIQEAVEVYCEDLVADGEPLPVENYLITRVSFSCDPENVK